MTTSEATGTADQTGYTCKRCGGPAPIGVGYAADQQPARPATRTACPCGYSRTPDTDPADPADLLDICRDRVARLRADWHAAAAELSALVLAGTSTRTARYRAAAQQEASAEQAYRWACSDHERLVRLANPGAPERVVQEIARSA